MEVISFGWVFLEIAFGHFDRLPLPGEEIYVDTFGISCGGAVTFAVEASRAGADVGLATVLGDDMGSRLVEDHALQDKVDLSVSKRVNGPAAGITVVLNYDGDRAFISHMPPRPAEEVREADRWLGILREVRPAWCYMHPGRYSLPVFKEARALGTRVALDVNFGEIDDYAEMVIECARLADVFLPNEEELLRITKSADLASAIDLASRWCPLMVVKRGGAGATAVERGRATEVTDGLRDVVVKDRTGAGDAFAGALVGTLVRGAGFLEAVAAGNTAGSEAVARLGALGELRHPGREHRL